MTHLQVAHFKNYQSADILKKSGNRPPWVKLHREFFIDYDMRRLRPEHRLLALFLVSFASEFLRDFPDDWGTFPLDEPEIARRIALSPGSVRKGIFALTEQGFLIANESTEPGRENLPLEGEGEGRVLKKGAKGDQRGQAPFLETPDPEWERAVEKLLRVVTDKDDGTERVFRKTAEGLPFGLIAKVAESCNGKPAMYATKALKSEKAELAKRNGAP